MKAGRELDAIKTRVAIEVFGWRETDKRFSDHDPNWIGYEAPWYETPDGEIEHYTHIPDYPRKIQDAWLVVEKLKSNNYCFTLYDGYDPEWAALFSPRDAEIFLATADTAPLAICLAAMKTVEG